MNVGVNGKASAISKIFVGVNSIAKEIDQGWIGDGNSVARPFYYLPALKPTPPTSISYSGATVGESLRVSWTAGSSPAGLGLTYVLEVSLNNGGWSAVTTTSGRSYNYTVPTNATYIQFRVKCRDTNGNESDYRTGSRISVTQFVIPTFTGSHSVFGNASKGRLEMYSSGTLSIKTRAKYDVFLVGGGSGGNSYQYYAGGGGGGYTFTFTQTLPAGNQDIGIGSGGRVGEGGSAYRDGELGGTGGTTSFGVNVAAGGASNVMAMAENGNDGGSGGGADNGNGGSNGGDGGGISQARGHGQGTTTRAFKESSGTLYAGGGGGRNRRGGSGGGADANNDAADNTGGGGGGSTNGYSGDGGSGIAIIRWGY